MIVNKFKLNDLSNTQKVEILAELLASSVHLSSHCSEDFQDLISQELESLPDDI